MRTCRRCCLCTPAFGMPVATSHPVWRTNRERRSVARRVALSAREWQVKLRDFKRSVAEGSTVPRP